MLARWAYLNGVEIDFPKPGKPTGNAYIEASDGYLRAAREPRSRSGCFAVPVHGGRPGLDRALEEGAQHGPASHGPGWLDPTGLPAEADRWSCPRGRSGGYATRRAR